MPEAFLSFRLLYQVSLAVTLLGLVLDQAFTLGGVDVRPYSFANTKMKVISALIIFLHTHWLQEEMESKDTQLQQKDEQLLQKERQLQEMDRQLRGTAPSTSEQQSAIAVSL